MAKNRTVSEVSKVCECFLQLRQFSSICLNVKIPLHLCTKSMLQECTYVFPVAQGLRKTFTPLKSTELEREVGSSIPWRRVHSRSSLESASPAITNLESFFLPSEHSALWSQHFWGLKSLLSSSTDHLSHCWNSSPHSVLISGICTFFLAHHVTFFTTVSCTPLPLLPASGL